MAFTYQVRTWWAPYLKAWESTVKVHVLGLDVRVMGVAVEAAEALSQTLDVEGYEIEVIGGYNPRRIRLANGGLGGWSLHAYGIAIDMDPWARGNPFVRGTRWDFAKTKFTEKQVLAVLAVRTNNGKRVWRWGGDFGDYMHWQIDCTPFDLATGVDWETVPDGVRPPKEKNVEEVKYGDLGNTVSKIQKALNAFNAQFDLGLPILDVDGRFFEATRAAVTRYQGAADLPETGVVGGITYGNLLEFIVDWADPVVVETGHTILTRRLDEQQLAIAANAASLAGTQETLRSV